MHDRIFTYSPDLRMKADLFGQEIQSFLNHRERFYLNPIILRDGEEEYMSDSAFILSQKVIRPLSWNNILAHHVSNARDYLVSFENVLDSLQLTVPLDEARHDFSLGKKMALFTAICMLRQFRSAQIEAETNNQQQIKYFNDVIGISKVQFDIFLLKMTANMLGLLGTQNDSFITINRAYDTTCATTLSATEERPWGDHCIPGANFSGTRDLRNVHLIDVAEEDNVSDGDDAALYTLRDICKAGDYFRQVEEIIPVQEYKLHAGLLFNRDFLQTFGFIGNKYHEILQRKMFVASMKP